MQSSTAKHCYGALFSTILHTTLNYCCIPPEQRELTTRCGHIFYSFLSTIDIYLVASWSRIDIRLPFFSFLAICRQGAPRKREGAPPGIKGRARFKLEESFYQNPYPECICRSKDTVIWQKFLSGECTGNWFFCIWPFCGTSRSSVICQIGLTERSILNGCHQCIASTTRKDFSLYNLCTLIS